ncbi:tetratricopeptide repeat protein [Formosa sediminum]|uniref:Tetratricopeptide repeat protein n=1 Tax=Formosa sediminum TaxID=2594004 RepID=A0A516GQ37_9FLAO|nr:sensor histidine kinase [Formosa sediminum]QDO93641.1 tetratricopeptide repeat protein [Formosa sediminum]
MLLDKASNRKDYTFNERYSFASEGEGLARQLQQDSLVLMSQFKISELYYEKQWFDLFLKTNRINIRDAKRIDNPQLLAKIYTLRADYFYNRTSDSAFYYYDKAEKIYTKLDDAFNRTSMLLNIAIIQKNEKDFVGSEVSSFEGIKLLDSLPLENDVIKKKAFLYNNLGLVYDQLEQYDDAVEYHNRSLNLKRRLKGDTKATIDNSLNNLALAYKNSGNYNIALSYYNDVLKKNTRLKFERPDFYALVLDNYAHTRYLNKNETALPELYLEALHICDSIGATYNSIIINQHLAEFYNDKNKKDSAKYYAYAAKDISTQYHNDDLLKSLLLLTTIESDSIAVKHYKDYIALNDSLQKTERSIRNKFARISYETKEIELKNAKITRERLLFMILSVGLFFTAFLIFVIVSQRSKNKSLQFKQIQQQANEEIYNLMLSQQDKIDEARMLEKRRISEELHDGILGRLFGTRLSLDSLNGSKEDHAIKTRSSYIEELKAIEFEIRRVSHDLNIDFVANSGYIDIIKALLEKQSSAYNLMCHLKYQDKINWDDISNKTKIHFYRIIQEALQNTYKHAKADNIYINFYTKDDDICLEIKDDGIGFDLSKLRKGIGLKNMTSRVHEINGFITITSEKQEGTKISIRTPIYNK